MVVNLHITKKLSFLLFISYRCHSVEILHRYYYPIYVFILFLDTKYSEICHTYRFEFKANHGEWVTTTKPKLGPGISERVAEALSATDENMKCYMALRTELRAALSALLEVIFFYPKDSR